MFAYTKLFPAVGPCHWLYPGRSTVVLLMASRCSRLRLISKYLPEPGAPVSAHCPNLFFSITTFITTCEHMHMCATHTHSSQPGWSCPPGDRCSVWRRSGCCDLWGEVVTWAVTLSWTLWVLNSIPACPSSMPGASPVMTTRDVPWGQNHPGRGLCCRWLCFCREGIHSFTKGLMEACMCHTGEHQLMRDTNYPQREKHGSGETRQTRKGYSLRCHSPRGDWDPGGAPEAGWEPGGGP